MRSHENEAIIINREVNAVIVPDGTVVPLKAGLSGFITQALGGSFTIYIEGNLYRIAGEDADAIGKESTLPPELPPDATVDDVRKLAWDQMRNCYDPEIPINIVELGLVYECLISRLPDGERYIYIRMTVTAPGCGMGDILVEEIRQKLRRIPTVGKVDVEMVFEPPWTQDMMSEAARLEAGLL